MSHILTRRTTSAAAITGPVADPRTELDLWAIALGELRKSSQRTYRARLAPFAAWCGIDVETLPLFILGSHPAQFHAEVYAFREVLRQSPLASATRSLTLAALSRVVAQLHGRQLISWTLSVKGFGAGKVRDTAGPPEETVRALLERVRAADDCPIRRARDEAILRLAISLGLRRSEIVGIDLSDVTGTLPEPLFVTIREKGADCPRALEIPSSTARAVRAWLALRQGFSPPPGEDSISSQPLFIRLTHAAKRRRLAYRLTDEGVAHLLDRLRRSAGIAVKVRPHGLRHRAITSLLETGVPLADVVAFARHRDPKTTLVYWDNIQQAAAKAARRLDGLFGE